MSLQKIEVNLGGLIKGEWGLGERDQRRAAWEMYVELVTRISVQPLREDEGLLRESLSSLYALFGETRRILRHYGPVTAKPDRKRMLSFGAIAVTVLNVWLRPFLAKWHPLLSDYEHRRPAGTSAYAHERAWDQVGAFRDALEDLRGKLTSYADLLAEACEIQSLHGDRESLNE